MLHANRIPTGWQQEGNQAQQILFTPQKPATVGAQWLDDTAQGLAEDLHGQTDHLQGPTDVFIQPDDMKSCPLSTVSIYLLTKWEQEPKSGTRLTPKWDKNGNKVGTRTQKRDKNRTKWEQNPKVGTRKVGQEQN